MVGLAAVCWMIWRIRTSTCFEGKRIKSPPVIICLICSVLKYWAGGLHNHEFVQRVKKGTEVMQEMALHFHQREWWTRDLQGNYQVVIWNQWVDPCFSLCAVSAFECLVISNSLASTLVQIAYNKQLFSQYFSSSRF